MASKVTAQPTTKQDSKETAKPLILSTPERRRLAGETLCPEATIRRWERGEELRPSTKAAIDAAALKLKLPRPRKRA